MPAVRHRIYIRLVLIVVVELTSELLGYVFDGTTFVCLYFLSKSLLPELHVVRLFARYRRVSLHIWTMIFGTVFKLDTMGAKTKVGMALLASGSALHFLQGPVVAIDPGQ